MHSSFGQSALNTATALPLELDLLLGLQDCLLAVVGAVVGGVHGPLAVVLLADVLVFGLLSHDKCL